MKKLSCFDTRARHLFSLFWHLQLKLLQFILMVIAHRQKELQQLLSMVIKWNKGEYLKTELILERNIFKNFTGKKIFMHNLICFSFKVVQRVHLFPCLIETGCRKTCFFLLLDMLLDGHSITGVSFSMASLSLLSLEPYILRLLYYTCCINNSRSRSPGYSNEKP